MADMTARNAAKKFLNEMSLQDTLTESLDTLHALLEEREMAAEQAAAARARAGEREALLLAWAAGHDSLTRHIARISDGNPHAAVAAIRARSDSD